MLTDGPIEATFCFIDIAGYTALTDTHGELAAADLVDEFRQMIRHTIEPTGQMHSLIGDCAFVIFPDPAIAIQALSALYKLVANRNNFPVMRTGMHHGTALVRANTHFGSTINLAARVAAQATGGRILCTKQVADVLAQVGMANVEVKHDRRVSLKNIPQPVDLYEVFLPGCVREFAIDPVCKMQVNISHAAGDLCIDQQKYWFCSLECIERFAKEPAVYISAT